MSLLVALLFLPGAFHSTAVAGTVYKCRGSHGELMYQDAPCARTQKQQTLQLSDNAQPLAPASTITAPATTPAPDQVTPAANVPAAPLTQLYRCRHAVDGSAYISSNGTPQPFLAPFGMLGAVDAPLAQAYGPGGAGVSAPEVSRGKATAGLVANNYVWVQDQCRPLSLAEICHALHDQYQENAHKLQHAFKSDQPPLQQRDSELRAQLSNCN